MEHWENYYYKLKNAESASFQVDPEIPRENHNQELFSNFNHLLKCFLLQVCWQ